MKSYIAGVISILCLWAMNCNNNNNNGAVVNADATGVHVRLRNDSGDYISVSWVHADTQETHEMESGIGPNSVFEINSHLGHKFEIRQEKDPETGLCASDHEDTKCDEQAHIQVTHVPAQEFVLNIDFEIEVEEAYTNNELSPKDAALIEDINFDDVRDPMEILTACKSRARGRYLELDGDDKYDRADLLKDIEEELHACLTVKLAPNIKASADVLEFKESLRMEASYSAENFTCVNTRLESSPDVATEEWMSNKDGVVRTVHKKLERPASRIHVVENFASPEECHAMEAAAESDLHVASTSDGKGGHKISPGRKAKQAGISPKFTEDGEPWNDEPISVLSARVYEYTNRALGMNLTHHGQEDLMSIQYFGRGRHDIEPDRYTPHCDGRCNGEEHMSGGRMATMVIYCTIPDEGGFTNFQNSNIHVRPNVGSAIFFGYFDPLTNITDNGLTQHSGCPVYEGEKKIITQWVRYGVSTETPWDAFNSLDILKSEAEN